MYVQDLALARAESPYSTLVRLRYRRIEATEPLR